jgi:parallel beta-helix repeat protein
MKKKMILCTLFLFLCIFSINAISATNVTVNPGSSIQSAVNNANSGDTIIVNDNNKQAYTYKESITLNKKLKIISNGSVTISAKNTNSAVFTINSNAAGSSINNFKLTNTNYCIMVNRASYCIISGNTITSSSLVGIQFYGDITKSQVLNNKISGVSSKYGNGISFEYGKSTYNTIKGNTISNYLNGILFNDYSAYNTVANNNVKCSGLHGAGIYFIDNSKYNKIIQNKVTGAEDGIAIQKIGSKIASYYTITGNTVENNKNGFWIRLTRSTISYNAAKWNKVSGLDITGSYNKITHNTATNNGICGIALGRYSSTDHNIVQYNILCYNKAGINSASNYTTISNNTVQHNTNNGIISTANHVTIKNNSVNHSANKILVKGSSNSVS